MSREHQYDMGAESERDSYRSPIPVRPAVPLVLLLGICLVAAVASAERRQMQLTLRQATALALENNLDIQIAGLSPRIREAQVTEEKAIFDVELRSDFTATDRQLLEDSPAFRSAADTVNVDGEPFAGREDAELQDLSVGIQQLTPFGGTYEVEISGLREDTNRRLTPNFADGQQVEIYTTELKRAAYRPRSQSRRACQPRSEGPPDPS